MSFFEFTSITDQTIRYSTGRLDLITSFIVGALCFAVVFILQAIGLFSIAKREGYNHKWMAFVPFFNTFYIGFCGQKNKFLKIDAKIISIIAAILELLLCVGYILYYVSFAYLNVGGYISVSAIPVAEVNGQSFLYQVEPQITGIVPASINWAEWCFNYIYIFISVFDLLYLFALVVTLSCFFQTYAARRYFLFAFTSILVPIHGIFIFVVRKNKGTRYAEYMREVQERVYRQYRNQQSFDQNPYNQNPYSGDSNHEFYGKPQEPPRQKSDDDPFPEFKSYSSDDPFDEFKN